MAYKILILYVRSGFLGHRIIAENYSSLLNKLGYQVQINDIFKVEGSKQIEIGNKTYFLLLRKISWLWRLLYYYWHHIPGANWVRLLVLPRCFRKTQQFVIDQRADLIISTHPIATSVVNHLKAKRLITTELLVTFSDWHTQRFWTFPFVNKYLVATSEQMTDLVDIGYKKDQIVVTGMLLSEHFYTELNKNEARLSLDLPLDKKVILVMGGGKGWRVEEHIVSLGQLKTTAYIIVIGGSEERKTQIENYVREYVSRPARFVVTGFVDTAPYFVAADLLVSKLGGLTTSQAFLRRLPVLPVSILPGQEDENLKFLKKSNSVLSTDKREDLAVIVDDLLSDQTKLEETSTAAFNLVTSQTPQVIHKIITSILNAQ